MYEYCYWLEIQRMDELRKVIEESMWQVGMMNFLYKLKCIKHVLNVLFSLFNTSHLICEVVLRLRVYTSYWI